MKKSLKRQQLDDILEYAAERNISVPANLLLDLAEGDAKKVVADFKIPAESLPLFTKTKPGAVPAYKKDDLLILSNGGWVPPMMETRIIGMGGGSTAAAAPAGAGAVPVGGIIMWSGTIAAIPVPDWELCNGVANAPGPDLRDKFVVGAKQDDAGVPKTNIEGVLAQAGGATGHIHSAHANLSHTNALVGDHTGLTHGLSVANHPDLTHVALASHPALTLEGMTHANVTLPGYTHPVLTLEGMTHAAIPGDTHAVLTIEGQSHAVQSIASRNDAVAAGLTHPVLTIEGQTHSAHATLSLSLSSTGTARTIVTGSAAHPSHPTFTASAVASHPTNSVTIPAWSISPASHPTFTASAPASHPTTSIASHPTFTASAVASHATVTAAVASHPTATASGLAHGGVGTHAGTDYGVHTFTAPPAHGVAGTVTHSFTEPDAHAVSVHDTVSQVPSYYALAFIQRMI